MPRGLTGEGVSGEGMGWGGATNSPSLWCIRPFASPGTRRALRRPCIACPLQFPLESGVSPRIWLRQGKASHLVAGSMCTWSRWPGLHPTLSIAPGPPWPKARGRWMPFGQPYSRWTGLVWTAICTGGAGVEARLEEGGSHYDPQVDDSIRDGLRGRVAGDVGFQCLAGDKASARSGADTKAMLGSQNLLSNPFKDRESRLRSNRCQTGDL